MITVIARWALALFFVLAGLNHFRIPEFYLSMIPPPLPPEPVNVISGLAEILLGIAVLIPRTRRLAGWGLIALLIAVFPANIYAAIKGSIAGLDAPSWTLWARLPFQFLFLAWVWAVTLRKNYSSPMRSPE
jgi:uncharacterized membrane protein